MASFKLTGTVINVQKFSINDGPGIRTTIFFKGCPLKCKWCANPESQNRAPEIMWDKDKCSHCCKCVENCNYQAINFHGEQLKTDPQKCNHCYKCVDQCYQHAIKIMGQDYTIEDLVNLCEQDQDFYEESGGGVTLSGGEVLSQGDFALALMAALKAKGIHVAIETTGFATADVFNKFLAKLDLLIIDVKHYDIAKHLAYTGVDPRLCWANLKQALAKGQEIMVRIPVIPDFNYNEVAGFAALFSDLGISKVQLLPFHQYGEKKYKMLNRSYAYENVKSLTKDDLQPMVEEFKKYKISAYL